MTVLHPDETSLPRLEPLPETSASSSDECPATPDLGDRRHPLYVGDWKRHFANVHTDIAKDDLDEPHFKRKQAMLQAHPEITELFGVEPWTKYVTLAVVSTQLALAYLFGQVWTETTWGLLLTAYIVGGTATGISGVIVHECTHNLTFHSPLANRLHGLLCNISIPFPISQAFKRYHLEHHTFQGVVGKDPDLPLAWETKLVRGNVFSKILWLFIFPMMYVVRGAAMGKDYSYWERINIAWTFACDAAVIYAFGLRGFLYLFLSLWLGFGIHVGAAHFIQEHYTFVDGQETYSYYGTGNIFFLNIGYHNEHHDFVKVPWTKLPALRKMAREFYDPLAYHSSWVWLIYKFLTSSLLGPQSRVGREYEDHRKARKLAPQSSGKTE